MNFPCTSIDDFYDDPDEIRKFALEQDFFSADKGQYPGKRTKPLDIINPDLFKEFSNKFFSLYYDFRLQRLDWQIDTYFQLIEPYPNVRCNQGWVHVDYNSVVSGVIYLNKSSNLNSGTVVCHLKENESFDYEQKTKHEFNLGNLDNIDRYVEELEKNNNKFEESIVFQNRYNRMISFDGKNFHKVHSYDIGKEPRLTQVFFVNGLRVNTTPVERLRKNGFQ